jgi:hypothetical protein
VTDGESVAQLAQIVVQSLAAGKAVEIDGLGSFYPDRILGCRFEPRVQVFVAYVREDCEQAERLYDALYDAGFNPWMDVRNLVPGQNWPRAIENAIEAADFFVACFSKFSVTKKGGFQAEIRYALDCARQLPLDQIFVVPVRLNDCHVPRSIQKDIQYVDLFPDWDEGVRRVSKMMRGEVRRRPAA